MDRVGARNHRRWCGHYIVCDQYPCFSEETALIHFFFYKNSLELSSKLSIELIEFDQFNCIKRLTFVVITIEHWFECDLDWISTQLFRRYCELRWHRFYRYIPCRRERLECKETSVGYTTISCTKRWLSVIRVKKKFRFLSVRVTIPCAFLNNAFSLLWNNAPSRKAIFLNTALYRYSDLVRVTFLQFLLILSILTRRW